MKQILAVKGNSYGIGVNSSSHATVVTAVFKQAVSYLKTQARSNDIDKAMLFLAHAQQSGYISRANIGIFSKEPWRCSVITVVGKLFPGR